MTDERIEESREEMDLDPRDRARLDGLARGSREGRGTGAPLDFAARVMTRIERERPVAPNWPARLVGLWRIPAVRWASGLAAAALALWVASAALREPIQETPTLKGQPLSAESGTTVPHRFSLEAPEARRVCLVGDFNDWTVCEVPLARDETAGTWSVQVELPPGRHEYMFVVDEGWVTDPSAPAQVDDGFGNRNAVIFL